MELGELGLVVELAELDVFVVGLRCLVCYIANDILLFKKITPHHEVIAIIL